MPELDPLDWLFVSWAIFFQLALIVHFALRRRRFDLILRYGWVMYALAVPATAVGGAMLLGGKPWSFWAGGLLYAVWALFGYVVEYVEQINWRSPPRWSILVPYVLLYLATTMFYWWPLALLYRPFWYAYALLFIISTILNVTSHRPAPRRARAA